MPSNENMVEAYNESKYSHFQWYPALTCITGNLGFYLFEYSFRYSARLLVVAVYKGNT